MALPLRLFRSVDASLDERPATILDLSVERAVVEHPFLLEEREHSLSFVLEEEQVDLRCSATVSRLQDELSDREQRLIYHTTLMFAGVPPALARAAAVYAQRLTMAHQANSAGIEMGAPHPAEEPGGALRSRQIGFVSCVFKEGHWRQIDTRSSEQPSSGFTVAAHEGEEQIELLRLAYEESDAEGRELLRAFAAASIDDRR